VHATSWVLDCMSEIQTKGLPFRFRSQGLKTVFVLITSLSLSTTTCVTALNNVISGSFRQTTFAATRHIFWALSASKMHLRALPDPLAGGEGARCLLPKNPSPAVGLWPQMSTLRASGVHPQEDRFLATPLNILN